MKNFKQKSVDVHQFSMIPRSDVPRSSFRMQKTLKTAFDAGFLIPIFCEEVLPGDRFNLRMTAFCRMATPIFPFMDNLHFETFFFFVPNRLVWSNWVKMHGEQVNPADSISFTVPQIVSNTSGYPVGSIYDYFGLPTVGQLQAGANVSHSCLPLRGYNLIWNDWFRDENIQNSVTENTGDGPDVTGNYTLLRRGKRKDYFTGALPWVQKFTAPPLAIGISAPVVTGVTDGVTSSGNALRFRRNTGGVYPTADRYLVTGANGGASEAGTGVIGVNSLFPANLFADLSQTTGGTINALRQSFQIQKLLERDARGGTRYTELLRAHFGVVSPDQRLQRPEYLGGGRESIVVNPVAQTSGTGLTGGSSPLGNLAAAVHGLASGHGFTQAFVEHGYVIGLCNVFADLTYQQGLRRHWSRLTRYDYYYPAFAMLGEQAILNKEIYVRGDANDSLVFGYQERWAELRYMPSEITGLMRSTSAGTINAWHLAQQFTSLPTLSASFIEENPPVSRVVAVGASANGQQFLLDAFFDVKAARPLPLYSVPGLVDHF